MEQNDLVNNKQNMKKMERDSGSYAQPRDQKITPLQYKGYYRDAGIHM
jgi:hypothetical protein